MKTIRNLVLVLFGLLLACFPALAQTEFTLPEKTETIQAGAFENVPLADADVTFPETLKRIESRAFAGTGLTGGYLPASIQYIAPDAFDITESFHPTVVSGSYAETWCDENGVTAYVITAPRVDRHTQAEIRNFISEHPANLSGTPEYRQKPTGGSFGGDVYNYGLLTEETLANAINMINQIRYIAGLNADVVNYPEKEDALAAAAMINSLNGKLSHYPDRPSVLADSMYDDLYELACSGAGSSNLHWGYSNLPRTVLSYMADSDSSNIDRVGHRRWILNPGMGKTTFGYYKSFSGMYSFNESGSGTQSLVAWPAQQTPLDYFGGNSCAWSVSFGYRLEADQISVTVTKDGTDNEWHFSTQEADGYFNVENSWYGQPGCVIFRPSGLSLKAGDTYHVTVRYEKDFLILQYSVTFFSL